jgi:phosphoribosylformylglycinamidine (FGAM) synthase-like enzyme
LERRIRVGEFEQEGLNIKSSGKRIMQNHAKPSKITPVILGLTKVPDKRKMLDKQFQHIKEKIRWLLNLFWRKL